MTQCCTGWLPIIFGGMPNSAYWATSFCNLASWVMTWCELRNGRAFWVRKLKKIWIFINAKWHCAIFCGATIRNGCDDDDVWFDANVVIRTNKIKAAIEKLVGYLSCRWTWCITVVLIQRRRPQRQWRLRRDGMSLFEALGLMRDAGTATDEMRDTNAGLKVRGGWSHRVSKVKTALCTV